MALPTRGKRVGRVTVLPRTTSAGINQIRCSCRSLALPTGARDPKGNALYRCPGCGKTLVSKPL
jgi:hypothetical protein